MHNSLPIQKHPRAHRTVIRRFCSDLAGGHAAPKCLSLARPTLEPRGSSTPTGVCTEFAHSRRPIPPPREYPPPPRHSTTTRPSPHPDACTQAALSSASQQRSLSDVCSRPRQVPPSGREQRHHGARGIAATATGEPSAALGIRRSSLGRRDALVLFVSREEGLQPGAGSRRPKGSVEDPLAWQEWQEGGCW